MMKIVFSCAARNERGSRDGIEGVDREIKNERDLFRFGKLKVVHFNLLNSCSNYSLELWLGRILVLSSTIIKRLKRFSSL